MQQKLQPTIRLFLSLVAFLLVTATTNAQIKSAYNIGSIGMSGTNRPIFSGPILINGNACLVISNGVKTLALIRSGYFTSGCRLLLHEESNATLTAFPNPASNFVTIKSAFGYQQNASLIIQLQLLDATGRLIKTIQTDGKGLNTGTQILTNSLPNGSYFIKAFSDQKIIQVLPIIKSN
jgi:hypothetical protein